MKAREFFDLVSSYRDYERQYERIRSPGLLMKVAETRQRIDKEIERVNKILKERK